MSDTVVRPRDAMNQIYRQGYAIVRMHSRHHGDQEIIAAVTREWEDWVRYDGNRKTWENLTECWNDFVDATNYISYQQGPCRICFGRSRMLASTCPKCLNRQPVAERVFLDRVRT